MIPSFLPLPKTDSKPVFDFSYFGLAPVHSNYKVKKCKKTKKKLLWVHLYADDGQNLCLRVPLYLIPVLRYCCNLSDVRLSIL